VFVTHDQAEALTMSNRIAVFDQGRIAQVGGPEEIYERPVSEFVAGFVGTSNLLEGAAARAVLGLDGAYTVRPEKIRLLDRDDAGDPGADEVTASGTVRDVQYLGSETRYRVVLDAGPELIVDTQNLATVAEDADAARGRNVRLAFRREHAFSLERADDPSANDSTINEGES
jgi:putative spermidine/putrescine transport system ATP-binding protein